MPLYYKNDKATSIDYKSEQIEKIFLECDTDGNKVLSKEELKHAFNRLGSQLPGFRAWRALQCADANNDGVISMDELNSLVKYACGLGYRIT